MNKIHHAIWRFFWKLRSVKAKGLQKGAVFPEFSLRDTEGQLHSSTDFFPEKNVVLWFTNFCDDCRAKIPLLNELEKKAGDRYGVFAISLLGKDIEWPRKCREMASFPFLIDPEDVVGRKLGLSHPPGSCPLHNLFILDRDGRILFRHHLSALSSEGFREAWESIKN